MNMHQRAMIIDIDAFNENEYLGKGKNIGLM